MDKYLADIFGLSVKIKEWDGKNRLPLYLRNKKEYFVINFGDMRSILMKNTSDNFNVSVFKKEMEEIEKYSGMQVVLSLDVVSTYQRNALINSRISFIVPYSQFYVPEFGICLKEFCAGKRKKVEKISAMAQFLLLYFIYLKKREAKSQLELGKCLEMSAMGISRAVQELQEIGLLKTRKDGTRKIVEAVDNGRGLYQLSSEYLQSPVQKRIYVDSRHFDMNLPVAGETALAKQSLLNYPKHIVYAMDKKRIKDIPQEYIVEPKLIAECNYVEIELWKYNPLVYARNGLVDIVSLAESFKETDDERVEMQMEEVMEKYIW